MNEDTATPAHSEPVAGPVQRPVRRLGWIARMRVHAIDRELAGLRAKLAATHQVVGMVREGSSIPGSLVYDMREIPRRIAELEENRRQLAA